MLDRHESFLDAIESPPGALLSEARRAWSEALTLARKHGVRNAQATVLAPTGTIAFLMDCDTTGIEPDISLVKYKRLSGGGTLKLVNRAVGPALRRLGYSADQAASILRHLEQEESIEDAPGLKSTHLPVFDCAFPPANGSRAIQWMGHIKMMAAVQPFLSGAISKTVNMPTDATPEDIQSARVLVPVSGDRQIPLTQLASIRPVSGPAMVRDEDGLLTGYVYIDLAGTDPQGYIDEAQELLRDVIELPAGYSMAWSGQFEAMERSRQRLLLIVPVTAFLIVLLIYLNTRSWVKTSIVLLAVPFSAIGAVWFLWLLDYNMSVGVWVGMVALLGVDAETGVFMLLYLDLAYEEAKREGRMNTLAHLRAAIQQGAVKRLRPKFMTMATTALGLIK